MHPELSYQEFETSAFIQQKLTEIGIPFEVKAKTGIVGMIHGGTEGPCIALRGDIDALPIQETNDAAYASINTDVMHACGHDVHTTCLLGAAMILNEVKDKLKGSVKLIFQLGEERLPGGATLMIEEGVLKNPAPKRIFGQHVFPEMVVGKVGFRSGPYMASADEIYLTVKGRGGHAAMPDKNIDTVLIAANIISGLQQLVSRRSDPKMPTVLSIGRVEALGATNIIPEKVEMAGTFRTFDEGWRFRAHQLIKDFAQHTAEASGGYCEVDIKVGYPFVDNDNESTQEAKTAAKEYLGEDNVVDLDMRMTAEDFAFYTQEIPGSFYRLGVRSSMDAEERGLHTSTFDVDEKCLPIGAGLMAYITMKQLKYEI
ncbi:MAG: M20 family metallopeptidase [Salibacteraceae bacterium]